MAIAETCMRDLLSKPPVPRLAMAAMDDDQLDAVLRMLAVALAGAKVEAPAANAACMAVIREQARLHRSGRCLLGFDAIHMCCEQLAHGQSPGPMKLAACLHILNAHMTREKADAGPDLPQTRQSRDACA